MRPWLLLTLLLAAVWTLDASAASESTSIRIRLRQHGHEAHESRPETAATTERARFHTRPNKRDCEINGVRLKHRAMRYYGENAYVACSDGKAGCYLVERVHDHASQVSCPTTRFQERIDEEERYRAASTSSHGHGHGHGHAKEDQEDESDDESDDEYRRRHRRLSLAVVSTTRIWDGGVVCYQLNSEYPFSSTQRSYIYEAMIKVEQSTNVRFVSTSECKAGSLGFCDSCANWVDFKHPSSGRDCNSSIGITDEGAQIMNLADRCFEADDDLKTVYGSAMHEIGHSLGLYHEHQHPQRSIGVFWDEIDQNLWSEMAVRDVAVGGAYDPESIMHYPMSYGFCQPRFCSASVTTNCVDEGTVFCNLNDDTDKCVDITEAVCDAAATAAIGQRVKLSTGDIEAINELYQSPAWSAGASKVGK